MTPYTRIQKATEADLARFMSTPFARRIVNNEGMPLAAYIGFLEQAYHRVKHTVPLLAATLSVHPDEPVREALQTYINEEFGHQNWVLADLKSLGVDPAEVITADPYLTIEAMISYVYHAIWHKNPWMMFGMIYVLEDMSVRVATKFAAMMKHQHNLGPKSLVYLTTHGDVDINHIEFLSGTINKNVVSERDLKDIIRAAQVIYRLWGEVWQDHSERFGL